MEKNIEKVILEVKKAISGKDERIKTVMTALLAGGHVLLNDVPGVGKTTLALAFSRAMGLNFRRVQFNPDVVPSDITGFSMYQKEEGAFRYVPGAANCNFLLADEINRTSSKTQAALLEAMQEGAVTVDGIRHALPEPFIVMATQNPMGTVGTQMLPEAQLDRFMIETSIGYPDREAQIALMQERETKDPLEDLQEVMRSDDLLNLRAQARKIYIDEKILAYISDLTAATREDERVRLGLSPRAALALMDMAKASAFIEERDYVIPADVQFVFADVARHRVLLAGKAQVHGLNKEELLKEILGSVDAPIV